MQRNRPHFCITSGVIACKAGVSQPKVSRALRRDAGASSWTRDRILQIAHELTYVVDKFASGFDGSREGAVAYQGLSAIAPDLEFAGRALAENVLAQIAGRAMEHQVVPVGLVVRGRSWRK